MSYILDALKKSQKLRKRGSVPDVLTVQEIVVHQPAGRRIWVIVVACIAGLNLLVLIWFFGWRSWESTKAAVPTEKSVPAEATTVTRAVEIPAREMPVDSADDPVGIGKGTARPSGSAGVLTDHPATQKPAPGRAVNAAVHADSPGEHPETPKDLPAKPAEIIAEPLPAAENRIYSLRELPEQLRRTLPEFAITAFMYSGQPSSRMVRINGRLMREGEELPPGVRLKEITPEGVILAYNGYRFAVTLK